MYGRQPKTDLSPATTLDTQSYASHIRKKLAELHDLVEAANHQKLSYDQHCNTREYSVDNAVWLFSAHCWKT